MKVKKGIGVSPGVAVAQAVVVDTEEFDIPQRHVPVDHAQAELARLRKALSVSKKEIQDLRKRTAERIDKKTASIFDFHIGLIEDKELQKQFSETVLGGHVTAEYAVATVLRNYAKIFQDMPQHLADRAHDVYDIEKRLLRNLIGQYRQSLAHLKRNVIVLAHDLTPSQTAGMDRQHVLGLAIDAGGQTSHTAIVARALGLPAVVGLNDVTAEVAGGDTVIIDGNRGVVVIDPDADTLQEYEQFARQQVEFIHSLDALRDLPPITRDGHEVMLLGNVEFPHECIWCWKRAAKGSACTARSFSTSAPTPSLRKRTTTTRIGRCWRSSASGRSLSARWTWRRQVHAEPPARPGAKPDARLPLDPFLPAEPADVQDADSRDPAGQHRHARVDALPADLQHDGARQAKTVVRDVIEDLEEEGIEHAADMPVGMMVETPSAALQCDSFAQEVDFFSIGTNDLIQYTLAVDRGNEKVASMFTAANPAVLRLIKEVVRAGQRYDVPVSMCGEMAGDPLFTVLLLGMGLRAFSCTPPAIPEVKKVIRSVTMEQALEVARRVMNFDSEKEIINYLRMETHKLLPEAYPD